MKTIINLLLFVIVMQTNLFAQTEFTDSIVHQGLNRTFIVHLPPTYNGTDKVPLIMVLHGGGNGDALTVRDYLHFDEVGDTANFITVFPYGCYNDWADGRGVSSADTAGIDDVSFLTTLKDTLITQYAIDSCKTYITGPSNGGMMSLRIASEKPHSFSAYAPIISSLPDSIAINFNHQIPVSLLLMPGTEDPLIPYEGGSLISPGSVIGVDSTIALFLANNGCANANPDSTLFADIDPTDNSTVTRYDYGFCNDSSEIVLYKIIGGGHTIPGMEAIINPFPLFGYINYDIDAAVETCKFFKRHSKCQGLTSITETQSTNEFVIFPNPTKGALYIRNNGLARFEKIDMSIFNLLGEKVLTIENNDYADLKGLPTGTYFLRIQMNNSIEIHKILKIE